MNPRLLGLALMAALTAPAVGGAVEVSPQPPYRPFPTGDSGYKPPKLKGKIKNRSPGRNKRAGSKLARKAAEGKL